MDNSKTDIIRNYKNFFEIVEKHINDFDLIMQNIRLMPYSQKAFLYNFKRDFDCTIQEYYTRRRISRICDEIKNTSKSILEISLDYGYSTQSSLNAAFKKCCKMTPLEYRNSSLIYEPFFIDIDNENIKNKILGLPYENVLTQWLCEIMEAKQVKTQHVNIRMYDFDSSKENMDSFEQLIVKILSNFKGNNDEKIKIKTTRLSKHEKLIFNKYINENLKKQINPMGINITELSKEMYMTNDEVEEIIFGLLRHKVEIKSDRTYGYSNIFGDISISESIALIKVII